VEDSFIFIFILKKPACMWDDGCLATSCQTIRTDFLSRKQ